MIYFNSSNANSNAFQTVRNPENRKVVTIMQAQDSKEDRLRRFAKIWADSRADAGKSQEFVAEGLGVSKKTVQNWEKGVTSPDLFTGSEWFRVLGVNPVSYYLAYLFPSFFENVSSKRDEQVIEQALNALICQTSPQEKRELLYLMAGQHGSSWYSLLQMFTAHCHTTMQSRVNAARMILENYEMEESQGELVCPEAIRPDLRMLKSAIREGKGAVLTGSSGYANLFPKEEPAED